MEDFHRCYRAVQSRDERFDGWFFTAVTSTGIYCRPSCPAQTPKPENVRFYSTAAGAQQAGFRACLRCRPDAAPGSPEWLGARRRGGPCSAAHLRRCRRSTRGFRSGSPAGLRGAPAPPSPDRRSRDRGPGSGPGPARPDGVPVGGDDGAAHGPGRFCCRLRQRAPIQRHHPCRLRPYPGPVARRGHGGALVHQRRIRPGGPVGVGAPRLPPTVRRLQPLRLSRPSRRARARGGGRRSLSAQPAAGTRAGNGGPVCGRRIRPSHFRPDRAARLEQRHRPVPTPGQS